MAGCRPAGRSPALLALSLLPALLALSLLTLLPLLATPRWPSCWPC